VHVWQEWGSCSELPRCKARFRSFKRLLTGCGCCPSSITTTSSLMVGWAELIYKPLGAFCLLHNAFLVVLAERARQLVIVHGRAVLTSAPECSHACRVHNFEDSMFTICPMNASRVKMGLVQEFFDKLPQMDISSRATSRSCGDIWAGTRGGSHCSWCRCIRGGRPWRFNLILYKIKKRTIEHWFL